MDSVGATIGYGPHIHSTIWKSVKHVTTAPSEAPHFNISTLPTVSTYHPSRNGTTIDKSNNFFKSHMKLILGVGIPLLLIIIGILAFYMICYVRRKVRQRRFLRELLPDYNYDQSEAVFDGYTQFSDVSSVDLLVPKNKVYWLPDQPNQPNLSLLTDSPELEGNDSDELLQSLPV